MEQKPQTQDQQKQPPITTNDNNKINSNLNTKPNNKKPIIWDCESTLYDSFELSSFQKQLDSAIINSSRTLSMPRLPSQERRAPPQPQPQPQPRQPQQQSKKHITSKVSKSLHKLLRSVFRASKPKNNSKPNYDSSFSCSPDPWFMDPEPEALKDDDDKLVVEGAQGGGSSRYYVVYEKSNGLSTIPEAQEVGLSPDIRSLVKKTMSERFNPGIYCV